MSRTPLARNPSRTRQEHAQETAQDYAEMIAELIDTTGEARVIDLARRLGVTHVTVGRTLQRLRHEGVVDFLQAIGVPAAVAQSDAEGIEHHVSRETLEAFEKQLRRGRKR